jgi:SAM-dependent methyltransferase
MPETLTFCPVCLQEKSTNFLEIGDRKGFYHLCACGAAFLSPRMNDDELREWYKSGTYREHVGEWDEKLIETKNQLKFRAEYIAKLIKSPFKSHLDIGCSSGELLCAVHTANPDILSVGVDTDPVLATRDFFVYSDIDKVEGMFDLITIIQTLEHINQPRKMIGSIYEHLNSNGIVIVEVPNRRAWLGAFSVPQHVVAYDEQSLRELMIGFKGIGILLHGHPYRSPLDLNILLMAKK